MSRQALLEELSHLFSPTNPVRENELLRGRDDELEEVEEQLRYFKSVPFIFGDRGVGKTSLARTAAQNVTTSDREHVYVPCANESRILAIFREISLSLIKLAYQFGNANSIIKSLELNISANPGIKLSFEKKQPALNSFVDINEAVRALKDIDTILPDAEKTVVVIDELEELNNNDRKDLAFFIKQIGDQEFRTRFILVGIAGDVEELIGAHKSIPRYIRELELAPLQPTDLMQIVGKASDQLCVNVSKDILARIAIVGNGFPHFAHLMGQSLLIEAVRAEADSITESLYRKGVKRAVKDSIQELRMSYETATQRQDDEYKHLIWALADMEVVDVRIDDWVSYYKEISEKGNWNFSNEKQIKSKISRLSRSEYGSIIRNTPLKYGAKGARYRYKRFSDTLMKGHIRLQAEKEGVELGSLLK